MVIILTDSLLSRFNKLNVPLYLHPGLPLKSVQQAYFTGFSAEVNARLSILDDSLPLAATGLSRTLTRTFQEHVYVTPSYANTAALPVYLRVNGC